MAASKSIAVPGHPLQHPEALSRSMHFEQRALDGCVLVADHKRTLLATCSLDLDWREMVELFVLPSARGRGLGRKMVVATERLAVQFGLLALRLRAFEPATGFFSACGYQAVTGARIEPDANTGIPSLKMQRQYPRRQTRFGRRIAALHRQLEIPHDYGLRHRFRLIPEHIQPVSGGWDIFGRDQSMAPGAARAWFMMRSAAAAERIKLQLVSAFRSVDYQTRILAKKLDTGKTIEQILRVSAAPGYSEHHSGRAIDITTPGFAPLEEAFENSPAFEWLSVSAENFGFRLSYPRDNRHGVAYDPWHWYHAG